MKIIFIAGTDTGVGKTIIAGALAAAMRSKGLKTGVMKPVSCGGREDAYFLMERAEINEPIDIVNPVFLKHPLSPNVAARLEKKIIDISVVDEALAYFKKRYDYLVVEGCGGLLVPLKKDFLVIDLIQRMKAETVLVSRSALGAINHSLLSLEALKTRKIRPKGVIFNRLSGGPLSAAEKTNPGVVFSHSGTPSLGVFPFMKGCSADCAGRAFLKHIDLAKILC